MRKERIVPYLLNWNSRISFLYYFLLFPKVEFRYLYKHKHKHTFMPTKTITITEKAYRKLKREKLAGESFSDVILRLTERNEGDLKEFAGIWKEADEIEEIIKKGRKEFDKYARGILP